MKHRLHHDLGYQLFISEEGGLLCQCERCARRKLQCPGLGPSCGWWCCWLGNLRRGRPGQGCGMGKHAGGFLSLNLFLGDSLKP